VNLGGVLVDKLLEFVPDSASRRYLNEALSFYREVFDSGTVLGHLDTLWKIKV
jgi:hypothetical protein